MITSPCLGSCRINPASQLCDGCARSDDEIAAWKEVTAADRARIWADLPGRRNRLGISLHRLGWTPDEILDFVEESLQAGSGAWGVGVYGASARFATGRDAHPTIDRRGSTITAMTATAAIRFTINDRTRVLVLPVTDEGDAPSRGRIILAIPRSNTTPRPASSLTPLGADEDAIRPAECGARLYDLGLNSSAASCCLRTSDRDPVAELDRRIGQSWASVLGKSGDRSVWNSSSLVIANPVARIEVFAPDHPASGRPAANSCVEIDPDRLAQGRETPPGMDLPGSFIPCAIFEPETGRREMAPTPGIADQFSPLAALFDLDHPRNFGGRLKDGMAS